MLLAKLSPPWPSLKDNLEGNLEENDLLCYLCVCVCVCVCMKVIRIIYLADKQMFGITRSHLSLKAKSFQRLCRVI